jgi:hypothetical protein
MRRFQGLILIALWVAISGGCGGDSTSDSPVDRQEIEDTLEAYLPLLAEAYATGDLEPLRPWAAEKEIARVHKRVQDLSYQGRTLVPTFRQLTIEEVNVWNYSNAYVTTLEVWDLVVYPTGSEQVLAEEHEQPNRVKYQLKRDGDQWRVLFRTIQE